MDLSLSIAKMFHPFDFIYEIIYLLVYEVVNDIERNHTLISPCNSSFTLVTKTGL